MKLLCITPNPALDRTLSVPEFQAGAIFRAEPALLGAGGKGLNVARAAHILGAEPLCVAPLGGHTGQMVADIIEGEGLRSAWTWFDGETRTCIIVVHDGGTTVINETGVPFDPETWVQFNRDIMAHVAQADAICLSGSFPPGVTPDQCGELLAALVAGGKPVWVDSSNMALRVALNVPGVNIKVNGEEIGAVLNQSVEDVDAAVNAAEEVRGRTGGAVVVTLGALGAVLVSDEGRWLAQPPALPIRSPVGSGDSFMAALAGTGATEEGLRRAVAAGTANALSLGSAKFSRREFEDVLAKTTSSPVEVGIYK